MRLWWLVAVALCRFAVEGKYENISLWVPTARLDLSTHAAQIPPLRQLLPDSPAGYHIHVALRLHGKPSCSRRTLHPEPALPAHTNAAAALQKLVNLLWRHPDPNILVLLRAVGAAANAASSLLGTRRVATQCPGGCLLRQAAVVAVAAVTSSDIEAVEAAEAVCDPSQTVQSRRTVDVHALGRARSRCAVAASSVSKSVDLRACLLAVLAHVGLLVGPQGSNPALVAAALGSVAAALLVESRVCAERCPDENQGVSGAAIGVLYLEAAWTLLAARHHTAAREALKEAERASTQSGHRHQVALARAASWVSESAWGKAIHAAREAAGAEHPEVATAASVIHALGLLCNGRASDASDAARRYREVLSDTSLAAHWRHSQSCANNHGASWHLVAQSSAEGQQAEARSLAHRWLDVPPNLHNHSVAALNLAVHLSATGSPRASAQWLAALKLQPRYTEGYSALALAWPTSRTSEALAGALSVAPHMSRLRVRGGEAALAAGDLHQLAIVCTGASTRGIGLLLVCAHAELLRIAKSRNYRSSRMRSTLVKFHVVLGTRQASSTQQASARLGLVWGSLMSQDRGKARVALQRAVRLSPLDTALHQAAIVYEVAAGKLHSALRMSQQLARAREPVPGTHELLAVILRRMGRHKEASRAKLAVRTITDIAGRDGCFGVFITGDSELSSMHE